MTWDSETSSEFDSAYKKNKELHSLFKFGMALVLESDDPRNLPLTAVFPGNRDYVMLNLQETHCLIFMIKHDPDEIEFIECR